MIKEVNCHKEHKENYSNSAFLPLYILLYGHGRYCVILINQKKYFVKAKTSMCIKKGKREQKYYLQ